MLIPPDAKILPVNWEGDRPLKIKISLSSLDDLDMSFNRKGGEYVVPQEVKDQRTFAKRVASNVEMSILDSLGYDIQKLLEEEEKGNG